MTYWQPEDWGKKKKIKETRERLASDRTIQTPPWTPWNPHFQMLQRTTSWEKQPDMSVSDQITSSTREVDRRPLSDIFGEKPLPEGLATFTGQETVGDVAEVLKRVWEQSAEIAPLPTSAFMLPARIAGMGTPLRSVARTIGGIGRKIEAIVPKAKQIEQSAKIERLAQETGLVANQDWSKFYTLVQDVSGKQIDVNKTPVKKLLDSLTSDETIKVIDAMGGDRPILLPSSGGKTTIRNITNELAGSLGGLTPKPKSVISEESLKEPWIDRIGDRIRDFTLKFDRTKRIIGAIDKGDYNGKFSQVYMHPMEDAMGKRMAGVFSLTDQYMNLGNTAKINREVLTPVGDSSLNVFEKIGVYLNSKNPDNLRHIMVGNGLTEKEIQGIITSLSPEEKAFATFYEKWAQENYPRTAAAFRYTTGKELPQVEGYWPILVERDPRLIAPEKMNDFSFILEQEAKMRGIKKWPSQNMQKGMTKARTRKANNALVLNAEEVFLKRMVDTEHYINMMPVISDLQKVHENPILRQTMATRIGEPVWREIGSWLTDAAMARPQSKGLVLEELPRFLRKSASAGAIGLNLLSVMRQPLALFTSMPEVGALPTLKGIINTARAPRETAKVAMSMSPILRDRLKTGYMAEATVFDTVAKRMGTLGKLSAKAEDISMLLATTSDRYTTLAVWQGAMNKAQKIGFNEKEAIRYADDILRRTQAMFNVLDMPSAYRRSGEWTRSLLAFTNQINQNWNYWKYDIVNMWGEKKLSGAEALGKYIEAFAVAGLIEGWIARSTPPDSLSDVGTDIADYQLSTIPLIGTLIRSSEIGGSQIGITTTPIQSGMEAGQAFKSGKIGRGAERSAEVLAYIAGLPVAQPKRTFEASVSMLQGKSKDWMSLIWGEWRREKEAKDKLKQQGLFQSDISEDTTFR